MLDSFFPFVAVLFDMPNHSVFFEVRIARVEVGRGSSFPLDIRCLQLGLKLAQARGWQVDHLCLSHNPGQPDYVKNHPELE